MSDSHDRIKFYSATDMSLGWYLPLAEKKLNELDLGQPIIGINDVLELYNVERMINTCTKPDSWSNEHFQQLKQKTTPIAESIGRYLSNISDNNLLDIYLLIDQEYDEDFWYLFDFYKLFRRISEKTIEQILDNNPYLIRVLLQQKGIVKAYSVLLTTRFLSSEQNAEILIHEYLADHFQNSRSNIYLPPELTILKREEFLNTYINWPEANPNYIKLIYESRDNINLPLTAKTKHAAQLRYNEFVKNFFLNRSGSGIHFSFEISYDNECEDAIELFETSEGKTRIIYGKKWIDNNLDYPTLWNNFIYMFQFVDVQCRYRFVSNPNNQTVMQKLLSAHGKSTYYRSTIEKFMNSLFKHMLSMYMEILKLHNISIEDMVLWFFSTYLNEEFQVKGFVFNAPSKETTYLEKCKILATEIDSILKQFEMFVNEGCINRELFEFTSDSMKTENIKSLIPQKYFYAASAECLSCMNLLFSDQTSLAYTKTIKKEYSSLYELILNREIFRTDFHDYNLSLIDFLVTSNCLVINNDSSLHMNEKKVFILHDLYFNQVCFRLLFDELEKELKEMERSGEIRYSSTLFSEPEQDYLSYVFTQSKFSNGLDLRNRYIHGNYPNDVKEHENDYFEFLNMLIFVIIKINQEFCYRKL